MSPGPPSPGAGLPTGSESLMMGSPDMQSSTGSCSTRENRVAVISDLVRSRYDKKANDRIFSLRATPVI